MTMFPTAVVMFCAFIASAQNPSGRLNWSVKIGAALLAGWAAIYAAAYWGAAL